eukprot:TRINITY_DN5971_c0_g1_i1.p1 TRINITY_DN5971_c0_g1~~TRINITY_DN5971_c0_g1_i1.p1  ORF type:complete len:208 (+),score=51.77 TRINITY_DN5971_c0_g1_i1:205-828(+)
MDPFLGLRATRTMAGYCLHVLEAQLKGWVPKPPAARELPSPNEAFAPGLFVTYFNANQQLRGCTGTYDEGCVRAGLAKHALSAATDPRCPPVTAAEMKGLTCDVTILSRAEAAADWEDWEVGVHGVAIYLDEGPGFSAAALPGEILSNGWSRYQTFVHLLRKAGYPYRPDAETFQRCRVSVFEADSESIHYIHYADQLRDAWGFELL